MQDRSLKLGSLLAKNCKIDVLSFSLNSIKDKPADYEIRDCSLKSREAFGARTQNVKIRVKERKLKRKLTVLRYIPNDKRHQDFFVRFSEKELKQKGTNFPLFKSQKQLILIN